MVGTKLCALGCTLFGIIMSASRTPPLSSLWQAYSQEILLWKGVGSPQALTLPWPEEQKKSLLQRSVTNALRAGHTNYIMLGYDVEMILMLQQELAPKNAQASILILESQNCKLQNFAQEICTTSSISSIPVHILVDSSPWALFMLTRVLGLEPAHTSLIFCSPPKARCSVLEKWRKLFLGSTMHALSSEEISSAPSLSIGAILHPDEPQLDDFFAHIPPWVHEVVIIWDGEQCPQKNYVCSVPLRQYCRPLQQDFSAQRNAMLEHCRGDWVLYLDADERLSSQTWNALPHLLHGEHSGGVLFPRLTFEGDAEHIRMGHGLWPDVQLRLFPRTDKVHFIHSIHEKVEGLEGNVVLAPQHSILHYSHIQKSPEQLRQRLAVFNAAGSVQHTLSAAYPCLGKKFFDLWQTSLHEQRVFYLPV